MPSPDLAVVLDCRGLRKQYGSNVAVDGVSLVVHEGERFGLLGPNGAGKTTFISMVCGLLPRDGGEVHVEGGKRAIGYVPQEPALYLDLNARENLRLFGRLRGLRGAALEAEVDRVLACVALESRAKEQTYKYSGGMLRRLNIAAGLLGSPRLLVLDEPTAGVDPQSRYAILDTLMTLSLGGTALLYTTHLIDEAERVCDRIGVLDEGRLLAVGTRRDLVREVAKGDRVSCRVAGTADDVARFVDASAAIAGGPVRQADDRIDLAVDDAASAVPAIAAEAGRHGVVLAELEVSPANLETVFLELTGKRLRDG